MTERPEEELSDGELDLLYDGLTDDVSFDLALIHLGLWSRPPVNDGRPSVETIETAFERFEHLESLCLIEIG